MTTRFQLLLALLVIVFGVAIAIAILLFPPQAEQAIDDTKPVLPAVKFVVASPQRIRIDVHSSGRIMAQTEIDLVSGVSGNIVKLSKQFLSGSFFSKGDLLVSIDPAEYDLRIAQAQAQVMEAQYQLTREEAEAAQAREEWQQLGQGAPNSLSLRIPQLKEKKAKLIAEQEELKNAKLLRQRTEIRAPFDGRVRSRNVGDGQYVTTGAVLGRIYDSDIAEVRLPLSPSEIALIDFVDTAHMNTALMQKIPVTLTGDYQGRRQTWQADITRSEGVVDSDTGKIMMVAQIKDPFGLKTKKRASLTEQPFAILPIGLYVDAKIAGRWLDQIMVLPTAALFKEREVAVIDHENRIRIRGVKVIRKERNQVLIDAGIETGERILVSGLAHLIDGLQVMPTEQLP
ncbi:MAG: efflux RND transporter periplasmic adaptor subunit [Nitrosomonas sp.]|nr:efflux RND transporter periplasmic adaptor subunit [Nitrosomonas sp.]